jgi:hypothetical protein
MVARIARPATGPRARKALARAGPPGQGYCKDTCTPADSPNANAGYTACNSWNHVVAVWRKS